MEEYNRTTKQLGKRPSPLAISILDVFSRGSLHLWYLQFLCSVLKIPGLELLFHLSFCRIEIPAPVIFNFLLLPSFSFTHAFYPESTELL